MNMTNCRPAFAALRPRQLTLIVGALLSVLLGSTGGCQGRKEKLSEPARILFDSLIAGNEVLYDSASANLGFDRLVCLEYRAALKLGSELGAQLSREADRTVRSRHSRSEYEAGERGIEMAHPVGRPDVCKRIDSLWYARLATKPPARP